MQVVASRGHALLDGAKAVSHREPGVPERDEGALHERRHRRRGMSRVQEEQVDVGEGTKLAAPVAAQRDHRALRELVLRPAVGPGRGLAAGPRHHQVHEVTARRRDLGSTEAEALAHAQAFVF